MTDEVKVVETKSMKSKIKENTGKAKAFCKKHMPKVAAGAIGAGVATAGLLFLGRHYAQKDLDEINDYYDDDNDLNEEDEVAEE